MILLLQRLHEIHFVGGRIYQVCAADHAADDLFCNSISSCIRLTVISCHHCHSYWPKIKLIELDSGSAVFQAVGAMRGTFFEEIETQTQHSCCDGYDHSGVGPPRWTLLVVDKR